MATDNRHVRTKLSGPLATLDEHGGSQGRTWFSTSLEERILLRKLIDDAGSNEGAFIAAFHVYQSTAAAHRWNGIARCNGWSKLWVIIEYRGPHEDRSGQLQLLDAFRDVMRPPTEQEIAGLKQTPMDAILA